MSSNIISYFKLYSELIIITRRRRGFNCLFHNTIEHYEILCYCCCINKISNVRDRYLSKLLWVFLIKSFLNKNNYYIQGYINHNKISLKLPSVIFYCSSYLSIHEMIIKCEVIILNKTLTLHFAIIFILNNRPGDRLSDDDLQICLGRKTSYRNNNIKSISLVIIERNISTAQFFNVCSLCF